MNGFHVLRRKNHLFVLNARVLGGIRNHENTEITRRFKYMHKIYIARGA